MKLARREAKLADLVAEGLTNKEIAYRMGLRESTVKSYLSRIFRTLEIDNRVHLTRWALANKESI